MSADPPRHLRSSQSISDFSSRASTPRPAHLASNSLDISSAPALPGAPRKISKNYHPYLVQTTSSSLLTRSPTSRPHDSAPPRSARGMETFVLPSTPFAGTESPPVRITEAQHVGDSVSTGISQSPTSESGRSGASSRKMGGLFQEWEDRSRLTPSPAEAHGERGLRKAQSAFGLSSTSLISTRSRTASGDSNSSTDFTTNTAPTSPNSSISHSATAPSSRAADELSPRKRSDLYPGISSPYRIRSPSRPIPPRERESSADESDADAREEGASPWRSARKVTLRPKPSLLLPPSGVPSPGHEKMVQQLEALERKFTALAIGFERLEGFLHPLHPAERKGEVVLSDEIIAGAGALVLVGMGLGVILGSLMSRR